MAEYMLIQTASEVQQAINKALTSVQTVNGAAPDNNGNVNIEMASGGAAIIDVVELPTENINEQAFYRLLSGSLVCNQSVENIFTVHCVETLPESGIPASNIDHTEFNVYYNVSDGEAYGYVDDILSAGMGVPSGWYPVATLLGALELVYSGVITNILDDPKDDTFRLLLEYVIYDHKDGNWTKHKSIGWVGTGVSAEIFNYPSNTASGSSSHAEGWGTTASGDYSHAEGWGTTASGDQSHAEGNNTISSGYHSHAEGSDTFASGSASHAEGVNTTASEFASHAEGWNTTASGYTSHAEGEDTTASGYTSHAEGTDTTASGDYSHAEGRGTTASGYHSHAEGWGTTASGHCSHAEGDGKTTASGASSHAEGLGTIASSDYQHVQGKFNIDDPDSKYAHIVGNGNYTNSEEIRSNAHTLDWNGNAWYAGTVEGTAMILKSPNGTRFQITVDDSGNLTATAITE